MTCLVLDIDDGAYVGDNAQFDIAAGTDLLIYCFVKQTTSNAALALIGGKVAHYDLKLTSLGYPRVNLNHSVDGNLEAVGTSALTLNTWTLILASYDYSAGILGLFVDTNRVAQVTGISVSGGIAEAFSGNFVLGTIGGGNDSIIGLMSDFVVSTDITGFDPSGTTITVPTAYHTADVNTVVQYKCDEGSGTSLDNAEGTAAVDLTFRTAPNDPSWDTGDSPFTAGGATSFFLPNTGLPIHLLTR